MATPIVSSVVLYDVRTGRKIRQWSGGEKSRTLHFLPPVLVNGKIFSPASGDKGIKNQAELIVGAASDGGESLRVWDANTGEWKRRLVTGDRWPLCLVSSADG